MPERDFGTAEGRSRSVTDEFQNLMRQYGPSEKQREVEARRMARAEEMASDEYYEKERKADMYQTLAEIGFNMASSKSPYLLQAVGEAAAAAMPGARTDKKERKALRDRALDIMGQMNDKTRRENLEMLGIAVDMTNTGIKQGQFEQELGIKREELQMRQEEFNTRRYEAEQAAIAAGMKFNLDEYLIGELKAGGERAENAKAYAAIRYGRDGTGLFDEETGSDKEKDPFEGFSATRN